MFFILLAPWPWDRISYPGIGVAAAAAAASALLVVRFRLVEKDNVNMSFDKRLQFLHAKGKCGPFYAFGAFLIPVVFHPASFFFFFRAQRSHDSKREQQNLLGNLARRVQKGLPYTMFFGHGK